MNDEPSALENPFEEDLVKEPRHIEVPVPGLNDAALKQLIGAFARLEAHPIPRATARSSHALMVVSTDAGYGKSHLVGRFFKYVNSRAIRVYRNQMLNRETSWKTLALDLVQELDLPEDADARGTGAGDSPQLQRLARTLFAHLWAEGFRSNRLKIDTDNDPTNNNDTATQILANPDQAFATASSLMPPEWFNHVLPSVLPVFTELLSRDKVFLEKPEAWLKVLFAYAIYPATPAIRYACREWIKGAPIEEEERQQLGLRHTDVPAWDSGSQEQNDLCRKRIEELFLLGAYFRPFVLCFDQTDGYADSPERAAHFGEVIAHLIDVCRNSLIVITANRVPWERIQTHFQDAYRHRIGTPPIQLEGINKEQGVTLAKQRLAAASIPPERAHAFLAGQWLTETFNEVLTISTRSFLHRCRRAWSIGDTERAVPLAEHYERFVTDLLREPHRLLFKPNIFEWLVSTAASGLPGLHVEPAHTHRRYFTIKWTHGSHVVLFGFEDGNNNKRWEAIVREARQQHEAALQNNLTLKTVFFRTTEHKPIPGVWQIAPVINEAKSRFLAILNLSKVQVGEIYAAHNLYLDALGGNLPPYTRETALEFLRKQLAHYWELILTPIQPQAPEPSPKSIIIEPPPAASELLPEDLINDVRTAARKLLFCDNHELRSVAGTHWTAEDVRRAARRIPEIRAQEINGDTVYQWTF